MHRIDSEDISDKHLSSESRQIDPDTRRTFEGIFFTLGLTLAVVALVLVVVALT